MRAGKDRQTSEAEEMQILTAALRHVRRHEMAIDGGANIGKWSLAMAPHFRAVVAFEPVRFSYQALRERTEATANIYPSPTALWEETKILRMTHPKKRAASTAYFASPTLTGKPDETTVDDCIASGIAIDSLNLCDCDLLKLDLEGAEFKALRGASSTLLRCRPVIIVEVVDKQLRRYGDAREDVERLLKAHGYQKAGVQLPNRIYVPC
jgi:FkbM family methyltransferase